MVAELAGAPGPAIAERWYDLARQVVAAAAIVPADHPVLAHDLPTDAEGLLVLRTFELWAHMHDIGAATGRPVPDLDAPRMALMSERFMAVLPFAVALRGMTAPGRTARLRAHRPGRWLLQRGPRPVGGARRARHDDRGRRHRAVPGGGPPPRRRPTCPVTIEGDRALADRVLASADALAHD